jgi:hypothetical protein
VNPLDPSEALTSGPMTAVEDEGCTSWPKKRYQGGNNKHSTLVIVSGAARKCLGWQGWGVAVPSAFPSIVPHPTSGNSPESGAWRAGLSTKEAEEVWLLSGPLAWDLSWIFSCHVQLFCPPELMMPVPSAHVALSGLPILKGSSLRALGIPQEI